MSTKKRAKDWLKQAKNDYEWASEGLAKKFYSQVCFTAQQAGEKAIKAIAYYQEYEVRGHSIAKIAKAIGINSEVENAGKNLDLYYISSRYPDALPEGAPFEFFTEVQATSSLTYAKIVIDRAIAEIESYE